MVQNSNLLELVVEICIIITIFLHLESYSSTVIDELKTNILIVQYSYYF